MLLPIDPTARLTRKQVYPLWQKAVLTSGSLQLSNRQFWGPYMPFHGQISTSCKAEGNFSFECQNILCQAIFLCTLIQIVYKTICFYNRVQASFIDICIFLICFFLCKRPILYPFSYKASQIPNFSVFTHEVFSKQTYAYWHYSRFL